MFIWAYQVTQWNEGFIAFTFQSLIRVYLPLQVQTYFLSLNVLVCLFILQILRHINQNMILMSPYYMVDINTFPDIFVCLWTLWKFPHDWNWQTIWINFLCNNNVHIAQIFTWKWRKLVEWVTGEILSFLMTYIRLSVIINTVLLSY